LSSGLLLFFSIDRMGEEKYPAPESYMIHRSSPQNNQSATDDPRMWIHINIKDVVPTNMYSYFDQEKNEKGSAEMVGFTAWTGG